MGTYAYNWRGVWNPSQPWSLGLGGQGNLPGGVPIPPTREHQGLNPSKVIAISDGPLSPTVADDQNFPSQIVGWTDFTRYGTIISSPLRAALYRRWANGAIWESRGCAPPSSTAISGTG